MEKTEKNKQFILKYFREISGAKKSAKHLARFTSDPKLIEHVLFFEKLFPKHELLLDEITCEGDRVIVRARMHGRHTGEANDIPPTLRMVETPFAIGYRVNNDLITSHWIITDQMELLEQLGLVSSSS